MKIEIGENIILSTTYSNEKTEINKTPKKKNFKLRIEIKNLVKN